MNFQLFKKRIIRSIFRAVLVLGLVLSGIIAIIFISAYIDWNINKDRLLTNLTEYYFTIKNAKQTKKEFVVLDDEGKIIESEPSRIYDRNEVLIGEFTPSKRKIVQLSEIPDTFMRFIISIEDRDFYNHHGIYVKGIIRAFVKNILSLSISEGGSSITQQLSKILFTSRKKTFYRKFLELFGTLSIEKRFTKDEIILMYLNTVYFGHGTYGVESASEIYFDKDIKTLNIFEMSLLVSLIPSPNNYSPYNNAEVCKQKHFIVLSRLAYLGLISGKNLEKRFEDFWNKYQSRRRLPNVSFWKMSINKAPYVIEYIRQSLLEHYNPAEILQGGLKIHTTIDIHVQNLLRASADQYLETFIQSKTNASYYKDLQCAVIVMDPSNGDVLGFIGGRNFTFENQLNRCFNIQRQIGSTVKPLVYASAFDTRLVTPITTFTDRIISYNDKGRIWRPKNYYNKYRGPVFLKQGLTESINTVSVQLLASISPEYFVSETMEKIFKGFEPPRRFIPVLSLALGTVEMSPFDVALCFSTLANEGNKVYPLILKSIKNRFDQEERNYEIIRYSITNRWDERSQARVFSRGACYITSHILKDVFKEEGTAFWATKKVGLKVPLAGKTGTTVDFKDAWCTGITPEFVISVWVGFDDFNKSLGQGAAGGVVAGPILIDLFNKIYWGKTFKDFSIPLNEVVFCDIDKDTGKLATSSSTNIEYNLPFIKGTQPTEY
ncbi:MAG: transglycosylase domain-containing protein [Spirochaetes bacterium]|nr:transglycosylase domain-containing protein [Spirochaetota bacterium]